MTKALQKQDTNKSPWTDEQVTLITNTVAKGATPDELKLFLYTASRTGLDPLTKQIHFVKRETRTGSQMTIQTGIDGYRTIAERSGTLAGIDDAIFDTETDEHPNKASVTVYRIVNGERVSFTASARWSEYVMQYFDKREGKTVVGTMWKKMPYLMLGKCAEALALRKAFPNDLTGLYTNEEMSQADVSLPALEEPTPAEDLKTVADTFEGEIVEPVERDASPRKTCPFCGKTHSGQYDKCFDCWKQERDTGVKKQKVVQKTLVNTDEPPF